MYRVAVVVDGKEITVHTGNNHREAVRLFEAECIQQERYERNVMLYFDNDFWKRSENDRRSHVPRRATAQREPHQAGISGTAEHAHANRRRSGNPEQPSDVGADRRGE